MLSQKTSLRFSSLYPTLPKQFFLSHHFRDTQPHGITKKILYPIVGILTLIKQNIFSSMRIVLSLAPLVLKKNTYYTQSFCLKKYFFKKTGICSKFVIQ